MYFLADWFCSFVGVPRFPMYYVFGHYSLASCVYRKYVFLHIVFSFSVMGTEHRVSHTQGKHCTLSYIPALFVFLVVSYNKCKLVVSMAC